MKLALSTISISLIVAMATSPTLGATTPAQEYMAPLHNSKWIASQEDGDCILQHDIPGLGNTKLRQGKQGPLSFELHITQDVSLGSQCRVEIGPPPWRHGVSSQSLGTINIVPGAEHLQAKGERRRRYIMDWSPACRPALTVQLKAHNYPTLEW